MCSNIMKFLYFFLCPKGSGPNKFVSEDVRRSRWTAIFWVEKSQFALSAEIKCTKNENDTFLKKVQGKSPHKPLQSFKFD
jgi:hypothetical protein